MISQDIRNLARVFSGFGALESATALEPAQCRTYAYMLDGLADEAAKLEAHTVPAQARLTPDNRPANVVEMTRSKPWGGNPPGSDKNGGAT